MVSNSQKNYKQGKGNRPGLKTLNSDATCLILKLGLIELLIDPSVLKYNLKH